PEGVVQIVHGFGEEAGDALVRHPDVPVITFTGSRETGVLVTKNAADELKHVHLELGGKNAIIVLDDADLDLAVDGIVWSAFGTAGQRCTAASRVIVQRDVNKAFKAMRDLQTGITYVNAGTTGAEVHLPFGGMKQTGNGHREAGQAALDVFTEWKSVYVDYSGKLQRAQIDTEEHPAPQ